MKKFLIKVNGTSYEVEVEEIGGLSVPTAPVAVVAPAPVAAAPVAAAPAPTAAPAPAPVAAPAVAPVSGGTPVSSPMPGTILKVNVANGDSVKKGDVLVVLEALKMENDIVAPCDGKVLSVSTTKGASVNSGDVLVNIG